MKKEIKAIKSFIGCYPEWLKSKKRREREWIEECDKLEKEGIVRSEKNLEEARKGLILLEYRLIKEKKSKLSRRERDNFMLELHKMVKDGFIKIDDSADGKEQIFN